MKKTTIIFIAVTILTIIYVMIAPALSGPREERRSIDLRQTKTMTTSHLSGILSHVEDSIYSNNLVVIIRSDSAAKEVSVTYPSNAIIARMEGGKLLLDWTSDVKAIRKNGEYVSFSSDNDAIECDTAVVDSNGVYTGRSNSSIVVTIVVPQNQIAPLLGTPGNLNITMKGELELQNAKLAILNFKRGVSLTLTNCDIKQSDININKNDLIINDTHIGLLNYYYSGDKDEDYYSHDDFQTEGKSYIDNMVISGNGEILLNNQHHNHISVKNSANQELSVKILYDNLKPNTVIR